MLVKIAPMGGRVVEVNVEERSTVGQALSVAEISVGDREIKIGGRTVQESEVLQSNGGVPTIILAPKVKGGN